MVKRDPHHGCCFFLGISFQLDIYCLWSSLMEIAVVVNTNTTGTRTHRIGELMWKAHSLKFCLRCHLRWNRKLEIPGGDLKWAIRVNNSSHTPNIRSVQTHRQLAIRSSCWTKRISPRFSDQNHCNTNANLPSTPLDWSQKKSLRVQRGNCWGLNPRSGF